MILGNADRFKGTGYVCFIDILGFSADILRNWGDLDRDPLAKIRAIKEQIPSYQVEESESHAGEGHRLYAPRVSTVSDSMTVCFGMPEKFIVGDLVLGLEAVLAAVSSIWGTAIECGYTVRGAIDFGEIYWDENELIGPAFINAYRLESQVAKNSRILVSQYLNQLLCDMASRYRSGLTDHLFMGFRKDVDGYVIVNPNNLCRGENSRADIIGKLERMRDAVQSGLVREKYNPLIGMLRHGEDVWLGYDELSPY